MHERDVRMSVQQACDVHQRAEYAVGLQPFSGGGVIAPLECQCHNETSLKIV